MLILDASVPRPIADALKLLGVEAAHSSEFISGEATDDEIVRLASDKLGILVTLDLDFQTRRPLFLDMAARGISVAVLRPPKNAKMYEIAEIILWHFRKFYEVHDLQGPSVISVKQPTLKARKLKEVHFTRVGAETISTTVTAQGGAASGEATVPF